MNTYLNKNHEDRAMRFAAICLELGFSSKERPKEEGLLIEALMAMYFTPEELAFIDALPEPNSNLTSAIRNGIKTTRDNHGSTTPQNEATKAIEAFNWTYDVMTPEQNEVL